MYRWTSVHLIDQEVQERDESVKGNSKEKSITTAYINIYKGESRKNIWKLNFVYHEAFPTKANFQVLMPCPLLLIPAPAVWWAWTMTDPAEKWDHPLLTFQLDPSLHLTDHMVAWSAMVSMQRQLLLIWVQGTNHPATLQHLHSMKLCHLSWDSIRQVFESRRAGQLRSSGSLPCYHLPLPH